MTWQWVTLILGLAYWIFLWAALDAWKKNHGIGDS